MRKALKAKKKPPNIARPKASHSFLHLLTPLPNASAPHFPLPPLLTFNSLTHLGVEEDLGAEEALVADVDGEGLLGDLVRARELCGLMETEMGELAEKLDRKRREYTKEKKKKRES